MLWLPTFLSSKSLLLLLLFRYFLAGQILLLRYRYRYELTAAVIDAKKISLLPIPWA